MGCRDVAGNVANDWQYVANNTKLLLTLLTIVTDLRQLFDTSALVLLPKATSQARYSYRRLTSFRIKLRKLLALLSLANQKVSNTLAKLATYRVANKVTPLATT